MVEWKCKLIENAINDPDLDTNINVQLCKGDCNNCGYSIIERNKLEEVIFKICDCFEEKGLKDPKLKFMSYILDKALKKTNEELEESNYLDFLQLLQEKDHYQEEFTEALLIFDANIRKHLDKIAIDTINAIKEG